MRRLALLPGDFAVGVVARRSSDEALTLQWSERIASERLEARGGDPERVRLLEKLEAIELAYREHCAEHDMVPQEADSAIDPSMSVEEIRKRLAERVLLLADAQEDFVRPPIFRQ
jgi:hypothetical protein